MRVREGSAVAVVVASLVLFAACEEAAFDDLPLADAVDAGATSDAGGAADVAASPAETGGGGGPAAARAVCDKQVACGGYGWTSAGQCEGLLLVDCADSAGYLGCVARCLSQDCASFETCDGDGCFRSHCD